MYFLTTSTSTPAQFFACDGINDSGKREEKLADDAVIKFCIGTCVLSLWPCIREWREYMIFENYCATCHGST